VHNGYRLYNKKGERAGGAESRATRYDATCKGGPCIPNEVDGIQRLNSFERHAAFPPSSSLAAGAGFRDSSSRSFFRRLRSFSPSEFEPLGMLLQMPEPFFDAFKAFFFVGAFDALKEGRLGSRASWAFDRYLPRNAEEIPAIACSTTRRICDACRNRPTKSVVSLPNSSSSTPAGFYIRTGGGGLPEAAPPLLLQRRATCSGCLTTPTRCLSLLLFQPHRRRRCRSLLATTRSSSILARSLARR